MFLHELHQVINIVLWHDDVAHPLLLLKTFLRLVGRQMLAIEYLTFNGKVRILLDLRLYPFRMLELLFVSPFR